MIAAASALLLKNPMGYSLNAAYCEDNKVQPKSAPRKNSSFSRSCTRKNALQALELHQQNPTPSYDFASGLCLGVMTDPNGLLQMRARYYSPELKRFLNQDILLGNISEPLTLNRFAYANGDPINNIDPFGLSALDSTGSWFGNALGITVGSASLPFVGIDNASFLANWISGSLPSQFNYAENSLQVQDMMASANAAVMRDQFYANNFQSQFNVGYDSDDAFFDTITNPYSTAFQVGGTAGSSVVNNGNGTATFTINNVAGTKSFFYHIVPNLTSTSGMMHSVTQTFQWTELIYQNPTQY